MRKICNNCGFQQNEFLNLGGKKYCMSCNSEISNKYERVQDSITISAYESQSTYDLFYGSLEWLELYVEKANYYPNWKNKKQLPKTITRSDIDSVDATRMRSMFSTSLTSLRSLARSKPDFFLEKLQGEFYEWLDVSGINVDNCPNELTQCLINLFEILKGKGEEFAKARREEVRKNIEKMSNEERQAKFNEIVSAYQEPLENEEEKAKSLEGQTYRNVNSQSRFNGDADRGEAIFKRIKDQQQLGQVGSSSTTQPNNPQQQTPYLTPSGDAVINGEVYEEDPNTKLDEGQVNVTRQQNNYHPEIWVPVGGGLVALITASAYWVFRKKR